MIVERCITQCRGPPWGPSGKEPACQCRGHAFHLGRPHGRRSSSALAPQLLSLRCRAHELQPPSLRGTVLRNTVCALRPSTVAARKPCPAAGEQPRLLTAEEKPAQQGSPGTAKNKIHSQLLIQFNKPGWRDCKGSGISPWKNREANRASEGNWLLSESGKLDLCAREGVITAQLKKQRSSEWDWKGRLGG